LWLEKPIKPIALKKAEVRETGRNSDYKEFQAFDKFLVKLAIGAIACQY
jgi:hypothetical protein